MGNDGKRDVLCGDTGRSVAVDGDPHGFRPPLPDGLGHQHMRDLGGADPECIGAERAVRRGVAVAADDQQARQAQSLFRSDHVHDALSRVVQSEQPDPVLRRILLDLPHHARDLGIGDIVTRAAGRNVMVGDREGQAGLGHAGTALRQPGECVKGAFMHVMAVDPEQRLAVSFMPGYGAS